VVLAVAGAGVYRTSADGVAQLLPLADVSAIALETGGHTLWIADRTNAQLLQVADPASNSAAQILLTDVDRLADISALGVSSDNKALYVANRSTLRVYLMNRENTELSEAVELDAPVTAFTPLTRPSFFLLGQRSKPEEPFYVMDEGAGRAIFFIPAGEAR
jgi:ABC-type uncharacterized transport system permease subunit